MSTVRELVDRNEALSIREQCELLGLNRSSLYYESRPETEENLALMRRLDELNLNYPVYGSRRLLKVLEREGVSAAKRKWSKTGGLKFRFLGLDILQALGQKALLPS